MTCRICGGTMVGDGYTLVSHCEFVELPLDAEPDSGPLYCTTDVDAEGEAVNNTGDGADK